MALFQNVGLDLDTSMEASLLKADGELQDDGVFLRLCLGKYLEEQCLTFSGFFFFEINNCYIHNSVHFMMEHPHHVRQPE